MDDILKRLTDYIAQCPSANGRTFHEMHEEVLIAHSADEIVKLRAALRFYGDKRQWRKQHHRDLNKDFWTFAAQDDGGKIARKALEGKDD
jgi:hypothetical protein